MEDKHAEVTFKYYVPEHDADIRMHINAGKMYSLLWDLDQHLRGIIKYGNLHSDHPRCVLAEEIREMIRNNVELDL